MQAQLADRVDVTRQTIGLIEAGGYNQTLNLCLRLADVTGKTLDELFWP
jgi:putative transcriptional regulator